MYKFKWAVFVTDELLSELVTMVGITPVGSLGYLSDSVERILTMVGGLPVVKEAPTVSERRRIALHLLDEATQHALRDLGFPAAPAGRFGTRRSKRSEFNTELVALKRVRVNHATVTAIAGLPGISSRIASSIVRERQENGPFRSLVDLDRRVKGLGITRLKAIEDALDYSVGQRETMADGLSGNLQKLMSLYSGAPQERLHAALSTVAMCCASDVHPLMRYGIPYLDSDNSPLVLEPVESISFLLGADYLYEVERLLRQATLDVKVCLFHMALPGASHPTQKLVDELIGAHERGLRVRVMLDQDRASDPYLSTVINTPAKELLEERGVECRFDSSERLLHSKYLVIDDQLSVLGSHNWSAGSYFQFDDLSLVIKSPGFAARLTSRFEHLWGP